MIYFAVDATITCSVAAGQNVYHTREIKDNKIIFLTSFTPSLISSMNVVAFEAHKCLLYTFTVMSHLDLVVLRLTHFVWEPS